MNFPKHDDGEVNRHSILLQDPSKAIPRTGVGDLLESVTSTFHVDKDFV